MSPAALLRRLVSRLRAGSSMPPSVPSLERGDLLAAAAEARERFLARAAAKKTAAQSVAALVHDLRWVVESLFPGRLSVDLSARSVKVTSIATGKDFDLVSFESDLDSFPLHVFYDETCFDEAELRLFVADTLRNQDVIGLLVEMASDNADFIALGKDFDDVMERFLEVDRRRKALASNQEIAAFAVEAARDLDRLVYPKSEQRVWIRYEKGRIEFRSNHATMLLADLSAGHAFPIVVADEVVWDMAALHLVVRKAFARALGDGSFDSFLREARDPSF